MGADFLIAGCRAESPEKARERLAKLSDNEVMGAVEAVMPWYVFDDDDDSVDDAGNCRAMIEDAITAVLAPEHLSRSEATHAMFGGEWYVVTGGASWGDTPTEMFDEVWLLDYSGVCEPMEDE